MRLQMAGRPVVVKCGTAFCPHPEAAGWGQMREGGGSASEG